MKIQKKQNRELRQQNIREDKLEREIDLQLEADELERQNKEEDKLKNTLKQQRQQQVSDKPTQKKSQNNNFLVGAMSRHHVQYVWMNL